MDDADIKPFPLHVYMLESVISFSSATFMVILADLLVPLLIVAAQSSPRQAC